MVYILYVKAFTDERGYTVVTNDKVKVNNVVNRDVVKHFCNSLGQKFEARDYQIDVVYNNLRFNRSLLLSILHLVNHL